MSLFLISKGQICLHRCYEEHKFNINTARICCNHFTESDYFLKEKLLNLPRNKWKLKLGAIPSINLSKHYNPKTSERNERLEQRHFRKKKHRQVSYTYIIL